MDYWGVVKGAWSITRRTRALWWLGVISAAQLVVYTFILVALAVPMSLIAQLIAPPRFPDLAVQAQFDAVRERLLTGSVQWLGTNKTALVAGVVVIFALWLVLGVLDVASQTGIITQVYSVAEKRGASLRTGLRDGFRLFWRAAGLLALAALPNLVLLLIMSLAIYATVTWPVSHGRLPDVNAAMTANIMLAPLSAIASVISVPLAVLVQLGMRFAVIGDRQWRDSFSAAWGLAKSSALEVALMYVILASVAAGAALVFVLAVAAVAAVAAAVLLGIAMVGTGGDTGASGVIALVGASALGALLLLAFQSMMFVWMSSAWTLFWRVATGHAERESL